MVTRRAPNRSINTPPWIENRNGISDDRPMAMPIWLAEKCSSMAHRGTMTLSMMATPLPAKPTP
jgi:hypothetical protein